MRWLLPRVLALLLILIAAVSAASIIGQSEPMSPRLTLLHLQDCQLPCWIGIVPGKTTIQDARQLIDKVYGTLPIEDVNGDGLDLMIGNTDRTVGVEFNDGLEAISEDGVVKSITLSEFEHQQTISDFPMGQEAALLGEPDFIVEWGGEGTAYPMLEYTRTQTVLSFGAVHNMNDPIPACTEPDPHWPLINLEVYDKLPDTMTYQPQPWRGFNACYNLGQPTP